MWLYAITTIKSIDIWALARAPDLHLNIHELVTSSNNSTLKFFPGVNFKILLIHKLYCRS